MGRLILVCLLLAEILVVQALAGGSGVDPLGSVVRVADQPSPGGGAESLEVAEAPANRRLGKHHVDRSIAGGGVIIGGLATAIFAAVFCYIRITRRRPEGEH